MAGTEIGRDVDLAGTGIGDRDCSTKIAYVKLMQVLVLTFKTIRKVALCTIFVHFWRQFSVHFKPAVVFERIISEVIYVNKGPFIYYVISKGREGRGGLQNITIDYAGGGGVEPLIT